MSAALSRSTTPVELGSACGVRQIASSVCAFHRLAARSVWPRTNDLGALDLSARSGADRLYDAGADRFGINRQPRLAWASLYVPVGAVVVVACGTGSVTTMSSSMPASL
jgi:hypothetical protein